MATDRVRGRYLVGVDIGGTFTDVCVVGENRVIAVGKGLTNPREPAVGAETVIDEVLKGSAIPPSEIGRVVHGTTLVTNALLERRGARTAMLTTAGFRDIVEMGRERRSDLYDLMVELARPVVPRHLRFGVRERTLADGTVEAPIDDDELADLAFELQERGVEAVAICFLHSFTNPQNEIRAREAVETAAPGLAVGLSSDIAPEIREYERFTTTTASVYVRGLVADYLEDLQGRLRKMGIESPLAIMLSNGGLSTVATASRNPIRMLESGPAAGAIAAAKFATVNVGDQVLSFDMGGTTAKVCVIEGGRPMITHDFEADRVYRLRRGSGLPIKTPVVDMIEIGVGGGSVARVNSLGLLVVGPESAGADPGPVCYGQGGTDPTITDADLVLGFLDPDTFLGGEMGLDLDAARAAIRTRIADPLELTVEGAAWGIHELVNNDMADAARVHIAERGLDVFGLPVFAFGGAGPVHACGMARALGATTVSVPPAAGVMSAVGFLAAPMAIDHARSRQATIDAEGIAAAEPLLREMEEEGKLVLTDSGVAPEQIVHERAADMRYQGQGFEIRVPLATGPLDEPRELVDAFERAYVRRYGRTGPDVPIEALTWRVVSRGPEPELSLTTERPSRSADPPTTTRPVWSPERGRFVEATVVWRSDLTPGAAVDGPGIVQERESTLVLPAGARCEVAADGSLMIDLEGLR